jgi:twitching motility protein PilT
MTPEARRALSSGWAEWDFPLDGKGPVRACVEVKLGLPHASLFLDRCDGAPVQEPRIEDPRARRGGTPMKPESARIEVAPEIPINVERAPRQALVTQPSLPAHAQIYDDAMSAGSTQAIDDLMSRMLELRASDLHLCAGAPPMVRVDGDMRPVPGYGSQSAEDVQHILLPIMPPRNREEFNRTHDTDFAYELTGKARFRANVFVDMRGMGAVFRVIPSRIITAEELNLPKEMLSLCHLPKGLVLVTGPTGSGKSTTLAALVDYVNRNRSQHVITIEDPIEFVHPNQKCLINQRQVGEHTDSFKRALRAALREDPDIVLLGEMRDLETISIALETAETGHLVFGTLHTSSAPATVDRIIDQYPAEQQNQIRVMLANSLKGVICQMLCKKNGGGRVAAFEIMLGMPAVSNLIREGKIFQIPSVIQTGRKLGMCLMNDSLFRLVKDGLVTPEEALSKSNDKATLITLFQQAGIRAEAGPTA